MSVFRLTNVSDTSRESKDYWEKRIAKGWDLPFHNAFALGDAHRVAAMDEVNLGVLRDLIRGRSRASDYYVRVLECACGDGRYADRILRWAQDYTGIDHVTQSIDEAKKNHDSQYTAFVCADMATFKDEGLFDVIFMVSAMSSIEQRSKEIIAHLQTMLRPGGALAIFEDTLYTVIWRQEK